MESGAPDEGPESPEMGSDDRPGRLGAQEVHFKVDASTRNVLIDEESMRVESTANFATVAADVCVFDGRWMYEVLHPHPTNRSCKLVIRTASDCMVRPPKVTLGTAGIQQLGWAAFGCQFTNEDGVGDSPDSYGYDGKRVKKWNVQCHHYGEAWAPADVIGVCIDLDRGEVEFARCAHHGTLFFSVKNSCLAQYCLEARQATWGGLHPRQAQGSRRSVSACRVALPW